ANPNNIPAYSVRSYCLLKLGQFDETIHFQQQMPVEIVVQDEQLGILCLANILKKDKTETAKYLSELLEKAQAPTAFQAHSYLYLAYSNLDENNKAFEIVEKAIRWKSSVLLLNYTDPLANT